MFPAAVRIADDAQNEQRDLRDRPGRDAPQLHQLGRLDTRRLAAACSRSSSTSTPAAFVARRRDAPKEADCRYGSSDVDPVGADDVDRGAQRTLHCRRGRPSSRAAARGPSPAAARSRRPEHRRSRRDRPCLPRRSDLARVELLMRDPEPTEEDERPPGTAEQLVVQLVRAERGERPRLPGEHEQRVVLDRSPRPSRPRGSRGRRCGRAASRTPRARRRAAGSASPPGPRRGTRPAA